MHLETEAADLSVKSDFGMVTTLSKPRAQRWGMPSSSSKTTSVGIPLIVRVAGTARPHATPGWPPGG